VGLSFSSPIESFGPIQLRVCVYVCANSIAWYSFLVVLFYGAGLVDVLALKPRL